MLSRYSYLLRWFAALIIYVAFVWVPVSNALTRVGVLVSFALVWFGLIGLCWRRRGVRFALVAVTVIAAALVMLPGCGRPKPDVLRDSYVAALRRYGGVKYAWGGEEFTGIDCSGLTRRALMDALIIDGIRTMNAGALREAMSLWWSDSSARDLANEALRLTTGITKTQSLNDFDHAGVAPGDLAVTQSGVHVMAFLGDRQWIEADPEKGKVVIVHVPSKEVGWCSMPMTIVRWKLLELEK